ncbi:MAG: LysR family transcriptional regulator [Bdellovibrionales bacterium]|jgi:LysR family transcriptional activator of nhaA|nr:LysR family transcriptional regulator [Bdellovibrionales bacterium]
MLNNQHGNDTGVPSPIAASQWLNYHHLFYFWTIASEGSIARASTKLRLGQPTLSTQLKHLEDSLGRALFERRNRRLILTEAGKVAFQYASEIFRMGSEMVEALHDRAPRGEKIHLQIGALDSVPKHMTLRLTEAAYKVGPCTVSIFEGKGDELLRELRAHRLDLLLSNFPPSIDETGRLTVRSIGRIPISVYGAPRFRGLAKKFPESLSGQSFVLPTYHSKLRHDLEHYFRTARISIVPVAETQDSSLQKLLGASGVGLIPIAESSAAELVREKSLVRLGRLENVSEEFWLISSARKVENTIAATLSKAFRLAE